jgi:hypothetical protein
MRFGKVPCGGRILIDTVLGHPARWELQGLSSIVTDVAPNARVAETYR